MRYAIDRILVGIETEVEADDFDDQYYIPERRTRFYCPECGEIVFFRAKGGNHPNQFYHQEKNESTPECDKRVDGRSELSLNQRVGLPLYLTGILSGTFQLSIGFPALGTKMLHKAAEASYSVEISSGIHINTIRVTQATFIENETTLIPVDFIPARGGNYAITITGEKIVFGLQRKWSDYADGFGINGAIFTYEETGGKKVRRGDSISTNRYYYIVTKGNIPPYKEISYSAVGKLEVGRDVYRVLKVIISASVTDKATFSAISEYLKRSFGVWLLECQPEIIPIWPPVVQTECNTPINGKSDIICAVSSGNANPNVYVYSEYAVKKIEVQHNYGEISTIELALGSRPIILSVDRKYVGREMTFYNAPLHKQSYEYEFGLKNSLGELKMFDTFEFSELVSGVSFVSNSKAEMYIGTDRRTFRHIPIRNEETMLPLDEIPHSIYILVESGIVKLRERSLKKDEHDEMNMFVEKIKNSKRGRLVPLPRWADYMIKRFWLEGRRELFKATVGTIDNNKIYTETLKQLRVIELNKR